MTKKSVMRIWVGAVVVGLVSTVGCVAAGAASSSRADAIGGRYLALGDSIAFGFSPLLEDPWIPKRFVGYPEVLAARNHLKTTNLSCPGQTAQAIVSRAAVDSGCFEMRQLAHDSGFELLHTSYIGAQLDAALKAVRSATPPSLISIQGGSNDVFMCVFDAFDLERCLHAELARVTASLRSAATQLRAGGFRGRIVLVGYYPMPGIAPLVVRLNKAIASAASQAHVALADTAHPFVQYAQQHHGDMCTTGLLIPLPDGGCDLHPTLIGQRLLADAVLKAAQS